MNPALHYLGVEAQAGTWRHEHHSDAHVHDVSRHRDVQASADQVLLRPGVQEPGTTGESWVVCLSQKTKDALDPPDVFLTTQDLGTFLDVRVDPLDEVCVQAQVQP